MHREICCQLFVDSRVVFVGICLKKISKYLLTADFLVQKNRTAYHMIMLSRSELARKVNVFYTFHLCGPVYTGMWQKVWQEAAIFSVDGGLEMAYKWYCWKLQEKIKYPGVREGSLLAQKIQFWQKQLFSNWFSAIFSEKIRNFIRALSENIVW